MFQFADDEKSRIAKLEDTRESCLAFQLAGEYQYLRPLTYLEDQITYVGTLGSNSVLLDYDSMTLDWETDEYKWL